MGIEWRDRKISLLRDEWLCPPHEFTPCDGALIVCQYERCIFFKHEHPSPFIGEPKKWHEDKNWPILLRELVNVHHVQFMTSADGDLLSSIEDTFVAHEWPNWKPITTIADAVCEAWINSNLTPTNPREDL